MQKMPYKHIAAHLKKTELACRLHYHQLSHGSHRRRRTSSVSSSASSASSTRQSPTQYHLTGPYDPEGIHGTAHDYFATPSLAPYSQLNTSPQGARMQHKMLLPKPRPLTPEQSPHRLDGLRINTGMAGGPGRSVDSDRLRQIYDSHRSNFWSTIAAEYGTDASPSQLEETWRQGRNGARPPTPGEGPDGHATHSLLKPSPFPPFQQLDPTRHFSPLSAQAHSAVSAPETLGYSAYPPPNNVAPGPYHHSAPVLSGQLPRNNTWSTPTMDSLGMGLGTHHGLQSHPGVTQTPATAITALLTDNKCPRHGEYCVGGHCLN